MGSKIILLSLFAIVFILKGTDGVETTTKSDIWDYSEETEYGTTQAPIARTLAPQITGDCTVNGLKGRCVEIANCKTINHGEGTVTYRSSRKCATGVCCVLSDVVDSTTVDSTSSSTTSTTTVSPLPPTSSGPNPSPVGCGIRNENGNFFRGGTDVKQARFGEFPWTVAIYKVTNGQEQYSGVGSLIHPRVVLTVANRFDRGGKFKVRAGDWYLPSVQERMMHEEREVESMVIHESYNSGSGANDIGLLFLQKDILQNMHINFACLPNSDQVTQPSTECLVTGWGQVTVDGPIQDTQKFVELPVVSHDTCQTKIRQGLHNPHYNLDSTMICAGGNGQDACKGDGGAPLVCPYASQNVRYYQAGIVSWGIACQLRDMPGVYTDVARLRDWVDEKVLAKGYTTNYYTP